MGEDNRADGGSGSREVGGRGRVGRGIGVVADVAVLLLWGRRGLALNVHLGELLDWHRWEGARAVLGADGQLRGDGIVLRRGDDVGFDEELEVLGLLSGAIRMSCKGTHVLDVAERPVDHSIPEAVGHGDDGFGYKEELGDYYS